MKNIENINANDEIKSIMLKISPVRTNSPLKNNNPAQNRRNWINGCIPKISIINASEEAKSIKPKILSNTIIILF